MDVYGAIAQRRSIRGFKPDAIPEAVIGRLKEAIRLAPSACNLQPWKFLFVQSLEKRRLVGEVYVRGTWLVEAPLIVVALGNRQSAWKRVNGTSAHVIDVSLAFEHLVLAATAEGLGTCWVCAFDQELLHHKLGLEPDWEVVAMTPVGYPNAEPRPLSRKPAAEIFVDL